MEMKKRIISIMATVLNVVLLVIPVLMVARGIYDVNSYNYSGGGSMSMDGILLIDGIIFLALEIVVLIVYLILRRVEKKQEGRVRRSILGKYFRSFKTRPYITIPATIIALMFVFYLVVFQVEDKLLFMARNDEGWAAEHYENVSIVTTGSEGYKGYFINNGSDKLLVYFYGNAMLARYSVESFSESKKELFKDYNIMIFDYPGYGLNKELGQPSDKAIYKMTDSLCKYVSGLEGYSKKYVTGFSLGTGVAVYAAAKGEWDALALIAPYDSITNVFNSIFPAFYGPFKLAVKSPFPSYKFAPEVDERVLIYCSEADEMVPSKLAKKLYGYFGEAKEIREDKVLSHNELNGSEEVWKGILDFFENR